MSLSAVNKFLLYGFVHPQAPRSREAVNKIAEAATQCRFESSSATDDEATLMKLLELLVNCLRSAAGSLLTDERVWQVTVCCFRIANIDRASYLLQKNAESTLTHVVLTVFSRIDDLEDTVGAGTADLLTQAESHVMSGERYNAETPEPDTQLHNNDARSQHSDSDSDQAARADQSSSLTAGHHHERSRHPYGSCVLTKMLSWLSKMTDPRENTKYTRIVGLRLINIALETAGSSLARFSSIIKVVQTELCKFLVQNSREEELTVLSPTLRVVFNLFNSLKQHLKVQLEVFFTSVHLYLADSSTARPEQKELALESLLEFCREPALMLDLYINYDCDVACTNLFETLCRCLCRNAVPEQGPLTSLHVLALEGVLAVLENMARRCALAAQMAVASEQKEMESPTGGEELPLEQLRQQKHLKKRMALAATRFNREGVRHNNWIPYVQDMSLLPIPATPESVAKFFRECSGLDLELIGDYLSQPDDEKHAFHTAVRKAYLETFDFKGYGIDEALREFLGCFRLPGEAQKIERLMESFAHRYFSQQEGTALKSEDTAFILSYSIIMLYTDLHNPQVSRKMTEEEFIRNNRGINDGEDLPREYLQDIYRSVQQNGIQLKSSSSSLNKHTATEVSAAWDGILAREEAVSAFTSTAPLGHNLHGKSAEYSGSSGGIDAYTSQWIQSAALHEKDMFALVADATLGAISFVWENTTDEAVLRKTMLGWRHAATIASYHKMDNTLNSIIISLCKFFKKTVEHTMDLPRVGLQGEIVTLGRLDGFLYHDTKERQNSSGNAPEAEQEASTANSIRKGNRETKPVEDVEDAKADGSATPGSTSGSVSESDLNILEHSASNPTLLELRRCLMTLRCIFTLSNLFADKIQEGWRSVVDVALSLYRWESFPEDILDLDDIRAPNGAPLPSLYHQDTRVAIHDSQYFHPRESTDDTKLVDWCTPLCKQIHEAKSTADKLGLRSGIITNLTSLLWREEESSGSPNSIVVSSLFHEALVAGVENLMKVVPMKMGDASFTQMLKALLLSRDPLSTSPDELNEAVVSLELFTLVALRNSNRIHISLPLLQSHIRRILAKKECVVFPSEKELREVYNGLKRSNRTEVKEARFFYGSTARNCWEEPLGVIDGVTYMPFSWPVILAGSHQNSNLLYNLMLKRQAGVLTERAVVDLLRLILRAHMEGCNSGDEGTSSAHTETNGGIVSHQIHSGLRVFLNISSNVFTLLSPRIAAGINLLIRAACTYEEPNTGSPHHAQSDSELSNQWELLWNILDNCMCRFYSSPAVVDALSHMSRVRNVSYPCFYYMHQLNKRLAILEIGRSTISSVAAAHLITCGDGDGNHHTNIEADSSVLESIQATAAHEHGFSLASSSPANYYLSLSVAARGMSQIQSAELVSKSAVALFFPLLKSSTHSDDRWLSIANTLKEAFVKVWGNNVEMLRGSHSREIRVRLLGRYINMLQMLSREFTGLISVDGWEKVFTEVLQPLINESYPTDDGYEECDLIWNDIEDLRSTLLSLLTKTFLQVGMDIAKNLNDPSSSDAKSSGLFQLFLRLWRLCLSILVDELCKSYELVDSENDSFPAGASVVFDCAWENIKNVILVIASEEYFQRMNLQEQNVRQTFWDAAWEILKQLPPSVLEQLSEIIDQVFDVKDVSAKSECAAREKESETSAVKTAGEAVGVSTSAREKESETSAGEAAGEAVEGVSISTSMGMVSDGDHDQENTVTTMGATHVVEYEFVQHSVQTDISGEHKTMEANDVNVSVTSASDMNNASSPIQKDGTTHSTENCSSEVHHNEVTSMVDETVNHSNNNLKEDHHYDKVDDTTETDSEVHSQPNTSMAESPTTTNESKQVRDTFQHSDEAAKDTNKAEGQDENHEEQVGGDTGDTLPEEKHVKTETTTSASSRTWFGLFG